MEPIPPQSGSARDSQHFVGRVETTRRARQSLLAGESLALTDPRRMGKTYWLRHTVATTVDFTALFIDYEGVTTTEGFLIATAQKLGQAEGVASKAKRVLSSVFNNVEEVGAGPVTVKVAARSLAPTRLLYESVMAVNQHANDRPVLVCMDEVPLALRNIATGQGATAAQQVLQSLRSIRAEAANVRWIVCGSVGFHHVLRQCDATEGDINDLGYLPLGPLASVEAAELAERLLLGAGRDPNPDAVEALAACTGGIPFLMHRVAARLEVTGTGRVYAEDCERGLVDFVEDRDESRAFSHYLSRLDPNYGDGARAAGAILNLTARVKAPLSADEIGDQVGRPDRFNELLDYLIDDHYLIERDGLIQWRYPVLRNLWRQRRRLPGEAS